MTEVRVLNQTALLRAYGFTNGIFNKNSDIVLGADMDLQMQVGEIEGDITVDSALEFFTMARYGRIRVSPAAQRVINRELPPGPEGDKILADAWLERRQKDQISEAEVGRALAFISSRSHISVAALRSHYRQTMESRLTLVARGEFPTGTPLPDTIRPLINYVATFDGRGNLRVNDQALFNDLVSSVRRQFGTGNGSYLAYLKVIESVDDSLRNTVDRRIGDMRISVMSPLNNNGRVVAQDIRAGR